MKNVTIQISDDLFNELLTVSAALSNRLSFDELSRTLSVSIKLHNAIIKAMLPMEDS